MQLLQRQIHQRNGGHCLYDDGGAEGVVLKTLDAGNGKGGVGKTGKSITLRK